MTKYDSLEYNYLIKVISANMIEIRNLKDSVILLKNENKELNDLYLSQQLLIENSFKINQWKLKKVLKNE